MDLKLSRSVPINHSKFRISARFPVNETKEISFTGKEFMKRIKLASERPPGPPYNGMCEMSIATLSATSYSGMWVAGSNNIISLPIMPVNSNFSQ